MGKAIQIQLCFSVEQIKQKGYISEIAGRFPTIRVIKAVDVGSCRADVGPQERSFGEKKKGTS